MTKYHVIILFLFLISRTASPSIKVGTYHPVKFNWIENGWHYLMNTARPFEKLELKEDSTFVYTACVRQHGKWSIHQDTLILTVEEVNWTVDSFNISGYKGRCPTLPKAPYKFAIKDNYIVRTSKYQSKGKEIRMVHAFLSVQVSYIR